MQEIFMDVAQDHFRTFGCSSPLLFLGSETYTHRTPVVQLLGTISAGNPDFARMLVVDDPVELIAFLKAHPPVCAKACRD
jgi:hypothetical protein